MRRRGPLLALLVGLCLAADADPGSEAPGSGFGISLDRTQPMSIESQELEASRRDDGRQRVVFKRNVRLSQADLRIGCDWLEALYGSNGDGAPEKITCRGAVTIRQADVEAKCDEVIFVRTRNQGVCVGQPAELRRGENVVEGPQIHFDTLNEKITVKGGVRIRVRREESSE
jgi:lipopolysaccharide transport protein LptA